MPVSGRVVSTAAVMVRNVAIPGMVSRFVTNPTAVGEIYDAETSYDSALLYDQATTAGFVANRVLTTPATTVRQVSTVSMRGR